MWSGAEYVEKKVDHIKANDNKIHCEDGTVIPYDVLVINVGSRTRGAEKVIGVWENSMTSRPINDLLPKVNKKEKDMQEQGIIPDLVVCGAGAAGIEMAMAFKQRWSRVFGTPIKAKILCESPEIMIHEKAASRKEILRALAQQDISIEVNCQIKEIKKDGVECADGRVFPCNSVFWATGAEPQQVILKSDLETSKGYFKVNDQLQSTSHPNVFAGGDCITMATYEKEHFPPKAGVYAVRAGPIIAQNVAHYLKKEPMVDYIPQKEFLSLLSCANEVAVGAKFGIAFTGRWVWKMKDWIDRSFMKIFDGNYLFKDFQEKKFAEPLDQGELYEEETKDLADKLAPIKKRVAEMDVETAGKLMSCSEEEEEFVERLQILDRMARDEAFQKGVIENFKPPYGL